MDYKDEMRKLIDIVKQQSFTAPLEQTLDDMKTIANAVKDMSDRIDLRVRKSLQPTDKANKKTAKKSKDVTKAKPFTSVKPPSVSVIAVCSSKLKHYSEALKQKADNDSRKLASDFEVLSARLDSAMYQQSKHVWMTQMAEQQ